MRNSFQKRVLPLVLTVCMILAMIPAAFAAGGRFTDVDEKSWASPYIQDVVEKGLMNGISETEFAPQGTLTRGMIATILSRMAEAKVDNSAKTPFADVEGNRYYTGAVAWAAENGLVKGYPDGTFQPANPVTRQEAATLVFRYAEYAQLTLPETKEKQSFTDGDSISKFAFEAVEAMQMAGILSGYLDGSFRPQNSITRAEAAKILSVFLSVAQQPERPTEPETEPTEPETEPSEPVPAEPYTITFVGENFGVLYEGRPVTEIVLPAGQDYAAFYLYATESFVLYDASTDCGTLKHAEGNQNYVLGNLTGDAVVTVETGLTRYTVTFDPCNGEEVSRVMVTHGQTVEKPADPEKTDDVFEGWHTSDGELYDFSQPVTGNLNLFAYWRNDSAANMTVYLDGVNGLDTNDGLTPETPVQTMSKAIGIMPSIVKNGTVYVTGTVTVPAGQTEVWTAGKKDLVVKRYESFLGDMFKIQGELTMKNLVIDGNRDAVDLTPLGSKALGNCIYVPGGTLTVEEGTVVRNNYHYKGQGGAMRIEKMAHVTINGGKFLDNEASFTAGAISASGSSKAGEEIYITINGGEFARNKAGSIGGCVYATSGYIFLTVNGGVFHDNWSTSMNQGAVAFSCSGDRGLMTLTGGEFYDNIMGKDDLAGPGLSVTSGYSNFVILPSSSSSLKLTDPVSGSITNNTSGKKNFVRIGKSLADLEYPIPVALRTVFVGAVLVGGYEDYVLTEADVAKIQCVTDLMGVYEPVLDTETNTYVLQEVPNNNLTVYLNGKTGSDENDGLTAKTAVQTFAKAKELLKAQIAAQENIPADAQFVISMVGAVTISEDTTLTFADFGENQSRCVLRRDAAYTSGEMFTVTNGILVAENMEIDGNSKMTGEVSGSVFRVNPKKESATCGVTINDGLHVSNFKFRGMGGVFYVSSYTNNMNPAVVTINGGHIDNLQGISGALAYLAGSNLGGAAQMVINGGVIENCSATNGLIYCHTHTEVFFQGGTFRNNTASTAGSLLTLAGAGSSSLAIPNCVTIREVPEGKTMELSGDIFLQNSVSDDDGNVSLRSDVYLTLAGKLCSDITLDASLAMRNAIMVVGTEDYAITEADLSRMHLNASGRLALDTGRNLVYITKAFN